MKAKMMVVAENDKLGIEFTTIEPTIVCLCGSTRFAEEFQRQNYNETMKGNIVLSVGFFVHSESAVHNHSYGCTDEQKIVLDELHKRKIDLADEILVLNVGGYIGDSTRSEINYAEDHGKTIRFLEDIECRWCRGEGIRLVNDDSEAGSSVQECNQCNGTGIKIKGENKPGTFRC